MATWFVQYHQQIIDNNQATSTHVNYSYVSSKNVYYSKV